MIKFLTLNFVLLNLYKDIALYLNNNEVINECLNYLKEFENDKDPDVVFFSKKASNDLKNSK